MSSIFMVDLFYLHMKLRPTLPSILYYTLLKDIFRFFFYKNVKYQSLIKLHRWRKKDVLYSDYKPNQRRSFILLEISYEDKIGEHKSSSSDVLYGKQWNLKAY